MFSISSRFNTSRTPTKESFSYGFGLIELMVSISIMAIISSIVLFNHNSFNGSVLLRSQVYELALSAREVQTAAVSSIGLGGQYRTSLGIHFDVGMDSTYRIFRDANNDHFHNMSEEFGQQGGLDPRFEIRAIRDANGNSLDRVSIVFERPNFDARFFTGSNNELNSGSVRIDVARRDVNDSPIRTLEITGTGQITVQ